MFKIRLVHLIFLSLFIQECVYSQPSKTDYLLGYGGMILAAGSELFREQIASKKPNWSTPNNFDLFFRNQLKWENKNLEQAELISDILVMGIVLPGIFLTPLITDHHYGSHLLLNIQILAATGIIINTTKFLVSRQRPYSYFKTYPSKGTYDNLSFYSGHTSFPFAITTSAAYILQNSFPHKSGLFWTSGIMLSSFAGYLRMAADHHYMSDVFFGALVGSLTGYIIAKVQSKRFFEEKIPLSYKTFNFSITF